MIRLGAKAVFGNNLEFSVMVLSCRWMLIGLTVCVSARKMKFSVNQFLICAAVNESITLCQSTKQSGAVDVLGVKISESKKAEFIIQEYFFFLYSH